MLLLAIFIVHISVAEWSAESSTPSSCSDSEVTITYGSDGDSEVTTDDDSKVTRDGDSKVPTTNCDSKSLDNANRKKLSMCEKPINATCGAQFDENDQLQLIISHAIFVGRCPSNVANVVHVLPSPVN